MLKRGGEILEEPDGEKPLRNADIVYTDCIPHQIQYTALGHLHRFQNVGGHLSPVFQAVHCPIVFRKRDRKRK
jgi:exonuclease SbcD